MQENRVTIKDIAEELGVSTATVSNVIHGKTKKKITENKGMTCNTCPHRDGISTWE